MRMRLRVCRLRLRVRRGGEVDMSLKSTAAGGRIAPSGLHHFRDPDGNHRFHLRVERDGNGILTVDASRILHLNRVASDSAWMILSGFSDEKVIRRLRSSYNVGRKQAASDLADFRKVFEGLLKSGAGDPVVYGNLDVMDPFQRTVTSPYRLDLALTYRCNLKCSHCYNLSRNKKELSTEQWKSVIRKAWDAGIPHVIFTGGEATLRDDLIELTQFAESLGLVTGLLTNGVKLADPDYVRDLREAGIDHIQITLESSDPQIHNTMTGADSFQDTVAGITNCLEAGIHTITNTTITLANADSMPETVKFLSDLGLKTIAANAVIKSGKALEGDFSEPLEKLEGVLLDISSLTKELDMRLIWYSPTRYCELNPLEFDLGPKRCTAGEYNLCIEPDGEVLPCQSWYESAGNIITEGWDEIWNGEFLRSIRNREWAVAECGDCIHFSICGGGCPLERKNGAACVDSI
jgi:radical SAM protein with 4Fe4S-binding SPASM domain